MVEYAMIIDEHSEGNGKEKKVITPGRGRLIPRFFTRPGVHPYDLVPWEKRNVRIQGSSGAVVFEQGAVEFPSFWSAMASTVVASKYFYGGPTTAVREASLKDLISRVVDTITAWGHEDGYFRDGDARGAFSSELTHALLHQHAAFNSPVWFNVGIEDRPQCSACFILSVDDSIESLIELESTEVKLFKYGSGTGSNLSTLRSSREILSGGGTPSGPVSFMRAFDAWAGTIKSGGKTRRAAKMQILNATHPDIMEFIRCKSDEERKAWALIEAGYSGQFNVPGGAYDSVAFQNANLSVRVTDEFMQAVIGDKEVWTKAVKDGTPIEALRARDVLRAIAQGTHLCGDPGMQFDTVINRYHTCPNSGRINASNPCSEYMHVDNSACNLASINLLKFLGDDGTFDIEGYLHTVDLMITAQDIVIDRAGYPTPKIEKNAKEFRQLGLGYANLGAFLMCQGLAYDSDEGREWASVLTSLMTGQSYRTSTVLAETIAPFAQYRKNKKPMISVMELHRDALSQVERHAVPKGLYDAARAIWDETCERGARVGYRNSQTTVIAPTGTIAFMMDCDTTGIEPDLALVKYKKLSDGGMLKIVNQSVGRGLQKLGYVEGDIQKIVAFIDEHDTIEGCSQLRVEHLPIFDCAFKPAQGTRSIGYLGHLKMMAAVQPFISGAISKTVNVPREVSVDEIFEIYIMAWQLGLKAVALYRDGSKRTQPLSTEGNKELWSAKPFRRRLPDERAALTHKFSVGGLEGYLTVGLYPDGQPGEIFIVVAKEGSTLSGIMDAFATSVSIALQYGVPLRALVKKFCYMRFEPSGFTMNSDIPIAQSIVDYVFRWLALKFLGEKELAELGLKVIAPDKSMGDKIPEQLPLIENGDANGHHDSANGFVRFLEDAPPCTSCGSSMMVRQAGCYRCLNCGSQGGCG